MIKVELTPKQINISIESKVPSAELNFLNQALILGSMQLKKQQDENDSDQERGFAFVQAVSHGIHKAVLELDEK